MFGMNNCNLFRAGRLLNCNFGMNAVFRVLAAAVAAASFAAGAAHGGAAAGFFHAEVIDGRARIVDPDGRAAPFLGIDHVRPFGWKDRALGFDVYGRFVETNYPSKEAWLDETLGRLRDWGFNTLANHCDEPLLRHRGLAHTITLYLGGKFARGKDPDRWITKWTGPCTGFPNVFHPDFERAMRERARELCAPHRDDPDLMGWFLDNELKWWGSTVARKDLTLFDTVRSLPPSHTARKALEEFLTQRRRDAEKQSEVGLSTNSQSSLSTNINQNLRVSAPLRETNDLREGFLRLVAERYFSVLCGAIREADPNHMILGCRFAGPFTATHPVVWEAAGKYCDLVSFNFYPWADLDTGVVLDAKVGVPVADRIRDVHGWCGKPLLVTEWSFPALDTGRPCYHGAGQRFPTQEGRAAASALYARTLLSLPFVAGYSYFMFLDQPKSGISETFREDSNYGLVDEFGRPYEAVTAALREVQRNAAEIHVWSSHTETQSRRDTQRVSLSTNSQSSLSTNINQNLCGSASLREEKDFVRLESAAAPGERLRLFFGGVEVGGLGALLQWRGPEGDIWTHASEYSIEGAPIDVATTPSSSHDSGQSATIRASAGESGASGSGGARPPAARGDGEAGPARFAIAIRASLSASSRLLDAEILSVENLGETPLEFSGVFLVPMPPEGAEPEPVVPNLWGAPERAWWRNSDGTVWGAASDSPTAAFRFWNTLHGKKDGTVHADARFTTGPSPVVLAPGETWHPPVPMRASIGLRDDFPKNCQQP